jgi:hypothetical protein
MPTLFLAADKARRTDPTLAERRYYRLMEKNGKHLTSAVCSIGAVLLTRIAIWLRRGMLYALRDGDGNPISAQKCRTIVQERCTEPDALGKARHSVQHSVLPHQAKAPRGRGSGTKTGVSGAPKYQ